MLKPAFVKSWITHSLKKQKQTVPCPVYKHAVKRERKMALESYRCQNSEIYYTIKDFYILKELQSLFTYKHQTESWKQTVWRSWGAQMNLVAAMSKDELKRENLSLSITLNHNPRCNLSSLCDISVNLPSHNAIWLLTLINLRTKHCRMHLCVLSCN